MRGRDARSPACLPNRRPLPVLAALQVGLFAPPEELSAAVVIETLYYYALAHQSDFDVCWCKGSGGRAPRQRQRAEAEAVGFGAADVALLALCACLTGAVPLLTVRCTCLNGLPFLCVCAACSERAHLRAAHCKHQAERRQGPGEGGRVEGARRAG